MRATDIRVTDVRCDYDDYTYRTPIKFGGVAVDRATLLNVRCTVELPNGKTAAGFGSMPLGNVWSFPSRVLTYADTLAAMKGLADAIAQLVAGYRDWGHPLDISHALEPLWFHAAEEWTRQHKLAQPIPRLCTLVVASPFDAAIHDAYGKIHGRNSFQVLGREFVAHDLGHYLGDEFAGEWLDAYILPRPKPRMPLYHLVGALDPLEKQDLVQRVGDGLPETLAEWIPFNGLSHLKVKLNGDDLAWDVERVLRVDRVAEAARRQPSGGRWHYSLDFNERCPNVGYLLNLLNQVREKSAVGFERIQYIEQPTARDLGANRENVMHEAAKLRPVVIDESLLDLDSLRLAREMGYTGAALKACKGQSQSLLLAAAAQKYGMFLCVQDLTCPGASLLHSAALAAHVPGVAAIEANSRQYLPAANRGWEDRFPGIFHVTDGVMATECLGGKGLGAVE